MSDRTYAEAARELNIPQTWLEAKCQARTIQHTRYGRHVRFTDDDIAAIRAACKNPPITAHNVIQLRRRAA